LKIAASLQIAILAEAFDHVGRVPITASGLMTRVREPPLQVRGNDLVKRRRKSIMRGLQLYYTGASFVFSCRFGMVVFPFRLRFYAVPGNLLCRGSCFEVELVQNPFGFRLSSYQPICSFCKRNLLARITRPHPSSGRTQRFQVERILFPARSTRASREFFAKER
jgi:hypothetical protein